MRMPRVYSPATLAQRWECSERHVLDMIRRGELYAMDHPTIGIPAGVVEAFEAERVVVIKEPAHNTVYVIEGGGLVKIGFTSWMKRRLLGLTMTSPVPIRVIKTMDGNRALERTLHERFAAYRAHGEWFRVEGDLADWINGGCET